MSIERSIYASLPLGVEQSTTGFQYFSYTPGFKPLLESDTSKMLAGVSSAGYTPPDGKEWLCSLPLDVNVSDLSENDYSISIPQDVSEANAAEIAAKRFHPYSISYKTVKIGGADKAVFWFGKNLGIDWSGGRPGNSYIYTLTCDVGDVKKTPIFYCSSPAVCCNISRSEFYPEQGSAKKPELLRYISSLEEENDLAPVKYSAGFDEITAREIVDHIRTDNNIDILCSMVSALMELKDGNLGRRLIIADERRNILLWIAALTYIFPVESSRELSFSSYTYAPSDFDINGVFVPELNDCFRSSKSGYNFSTVRGSYAVYDFSVGEYAPEVAVKDGFFITMLKSAFKINLSLIDDYKKYILEHTLYRGLTSEYGLGYSLYAYMNDKKTYTLSEATAFAEKYTDMSEKKALLNKLADNYQKIGEKEADIEALNEYLSFCADNGVESRENINRLFAEKFNEVFFGNTADDKEVIACAELCAKICGVSSDQFAVKFAETNSMTKLTDVVLHTPSIVRIMHIHGAVVQYADKNRLPLSPRSEAGKIVKSTIDRMIVSDSIKSSTQIKAHIQQNFEYLHTVSGRLGFCDSVMSSLAERGFSNACAGVLDCVSEMYMTGDSSARSELFAELKRSDFAKEHIRQIIKRIKSDNNIISQLNAFTELYSYGGSLASGYAEENKSDVASALNHLHSTSYEENLNVYFAVYKFYDLLFEKYNVKIITSEAEELLGKYVSTLSVLYPQLLLGDKYLNEMNEMRRAFTKFGVREYDSIVEMFNSLAAMYDDLSSNKSNSCYESEKFRFRPIELSALPNNIREACIKTVGELNGEYMAKNEIMPLFWQTVVCGGAERERVNQTIFTYMFKAGLKEIKHNGRQAADIILYSIVHGYTDVLDSLDSWLDECNVKKNVVDHLTKDLNAITEHKVKPNTILNSVESRQLRKYLEIAQKHYEGSGGFFAGLSGLFKNKK